MIVVGHRNGTFGPVSFYLGKLASAMEDPIEARKLLAAARSTARSMDARPFVAMVDAEDACIALKLGGSTHREEAGRLAASAQATADALDLPGVTRVAKTVLAS